MTKCPNCQSENGKEITREIGDKKIDVWKCLVCNGEHKISLKTQPTEIAHATTTTAPRTTGHGEISTTTEHKTSEHEKAERPATRSPGSDPERTDRATA